MKNIFVKFIILGLISSSLIANQRVNAQYKEQCQYRVYGNGELNQFTAGEMLGVVNGILFMIEPNNRTDYAKAPFGTIIDKACQIALKNMSSRGFETDYKLAVLKLFDKRFNSLISKP